MITDDLVPSWLTSWVAWKNFYTKENGQPFSALLEEMNLKRLPISTEFISHYGTFCPYCQGSSVVESKDFGVIFCICELLDKINKVQNHHRQIRSSVSKASLDDIKFPYEMGRMYRSTMQDFIKTAREFIASPDYWIFVSGYLGTGKTHVLKAINAAFDPMALYISARDLEQQTHTFRKKDMLDFFYDTLTKAPILILDDIGMEYGGKLVKSIMEKVIDYRYERFPDLPVILASNMLPKEFPEYIPRASDRLFDKSVTKIHVLQANQSYRKLREMGK